MIGQDGISAIAVGRPNLNSTFYVRLLLWHAVSKELQPLRAKYGILSLTD